jgi:sulfoxide reductase heme-binding subunit YedZ
MSTGLLAAAGPSPLWYLTRGTGLVSLLLLTATVVLGIVNLSQLSSPRWPRFATAGLHRNVSLLVVVVLAVHIATAELDTFAPVGWLSVLVPFGSAYRPVWLGLGTLAFDLLLAVVITSLLRGRLGYRAWRAVHWAAYLSWPLAVVHGLGTGTDARLSWALGLTVVCVAAVLCAAAWRLTHGWPAQSAARLASGAAGSLAVIIVLAWAVTGPLRPGWARRAGTPASLLASAAAQPAPAASQPASPSGGGSPAVAGAGLPAPPFTGTLAGRLRQTGPDSSGQVTIDITTNVTGAATGILDVVLRGQGSDGGVSLQTSSVTFGSTSAPSDYRGQVVSLSGTQLIASVTSSSGRPLQLVIQLQIDPAANTVTGTLQAQTAGDGQ